MRGLGSRLVKRWRFFACKVGFLLQDRTKFGTAGLFRLIEHAKAVYEQSFILSPKLKQNAGTWWWDFASKYSTETRKINAAAFELVGLGLRP